MSSADQKQYKQLIVVMLIILFVFFLMFNLYYEFRTSKIYLDENTNKKIFSKMILDENKNIKSTKPQYDQKGCSDAIIKYMTNPNFINSDFIAQVTNTNSRLEFFQITEQKLYFSHPISGFDHDKTISSLSINPARVELGVLNGEKNILIGKYEFNRPESAIFCLPASDLKFDKNKMIRIKYTDTEYTISIEELYYCLLNFNQYQGYIEVLKDYRFGKKKIFINHSPWIITGEEPSLNRFAKLLVKEYQSPEDKAQILLDFVTSQIQYNYREAYSNYETMKRANEVLLSKNSDCSGKTILYASLLEQIAAKYLILYLENHITLAVEGNFRKRNGLYFRFGGEEYFIAETTYPAFRIGLTSIDKQYKIKFIQKPGDYQKIYNASNGTSLKFDLQ